MLVCMLLAVVTLAAYWRVKDCDFVRYDDNVYVTANPPMSEGLNAETTKWAFTSLHAANWHPLTWISLLADMRMSGMDPEQFHVTNLLLHLANVLLLFLLLKRMTKSTWKSAFVAALFAVHPLHVESVAWISERKDVLSTFFWMLTTWAYVRYTERPGFGRYLLVPLFLALGLMAKPMLVALPVTLLLLDYWPLKRVKNKEERRKKVWEKGPLFVLSLVSCIVTYHAQKAGSAVNEFEAIPLAMRLSNAVTAYLLYLWKMIWPAKLAVLYPHPGPFLPIWLVALSAVLLLGVTAFALLSGRKRPYLAVGWLWYVITLVPVIGIIQVGEQAMADRYTYVPLIGIFIMLAWGVPELLRKGEMAKGRKGEPSNPVPPSTINLRRPPDASGGAAHSAADHQPSTMPLAVAAVVIVMALSACTWKQVGYWQDSVALFSHEVEVAPRSATGWYSLAGALNESGQYAEAVDAYEKAVQYKPGYMEAYYNMAVAAFKAGEYAQAWKAVHTAGELGASIQPEFLDALSAKMPDPRQ